MSQMPNGQAEIASACEPSSVCLERAGYGTSEIGAYEMANRLFGYEGWSIEVTSCNVVFENRTRAGLSNCVYRLGIRLNVFKHNRSTVREAIGVGENTSAKVAEAHNCALVMALDAAFKAVIATFGASRQRSSVLDCTTPDGAGGGPPNTPLTEVRSAPSRARSACTAGLTSAAEIELVGPDGTACNMRSVEGFCSGLRQLVMRARDAAEVGYLEDANAAMILGLLTGDNGVSERRAGAEIVRLFKARFKELV